MTPADKPLTLDEINALLADVAEEMRDQWNTLPVQTRSAGMADWVTQNEPRIGELVRQRHDASQAPDCVDVEDLGRQLGWSAQELSHALACVSNDPGYGASFGAECVIATHSGRELRSPAFPETCSYVRVTQAGFELAFWTSDEWAEEPQEVLGAMLGCLKNGVEAPEAPGLVRRLDPRSRIERSGEGA